MTKRIPKLLANSNDLQFCSELLNILFDNIKCLIIYTITMLVIEAIGN